VSGVNVREVGHSLSLVGLQPQSGSPYATTHRLLPNQNASFPHYPHYYLYLLHSTTSGRLPRPTARRLLCLRLLNGLSSQREHWRSSSVRRPPSGSPQSQCLQNPKTLSFLLSQPFLVMTSSDFIRQELFLFTPVSSIQTPKCKTGGRR